MQKEPVKISDIFHSSYGLLKSSAPSSALTCLLCGKEDDERNDDDEKQGDNGNEADLQGGPAGLLSRFGGVGLCHSRVSSFGCQL